MIGTQIVVAIGFPCIDRLEVEIGSDARGEAIGTDAVERDLLDGDASGDRR